MNPMMQEALASILRWALAGLAGYLVQHGVWTQGDASGYVAAAAVGIVALGWGLWQKYKSRLTLLTALTLPAGSTELEAKQKVESGAVVPTVTTPANTVPGIPKVLALLLPFLLAGGLLCGAMTLSACASGGAVHVATAADSALVQALHQVRLDESRAYLAGAYPLAKHQQYLRVILQADQDALALTKALQAGQTSSAVVTATGGSFQAILTDVSSLLPASNLSTSLRLVLNLLGVA